MNDFVLDSAHAHCAYGDAMSSGSRKDKPGKTK